MLPDQTFSTDYSKVGIAKDPNYIRHCPFCGHMPQVTGEADRPAEVECVNPECTLWGHKFFLFDWNKRAVKEKDISKLLFTCTPVYKAGTWKRYNWFDCRCCGAGSYTPAKIKHKEGCITDALLDIYGTPRRTRIRSKKR